jgi:hypothetical protein
MSLARDALRSSRGRIVLGVVAAYLAWQGWLYCGGAGGRSPRASRRTPGASTCS